MPRTTSRLPAYTLLEITLAIGLLMGLMAFALPNMMKEIENRRLPESADRMRSMLMLVRANAMYDGLRYRIRFAMDDEIDSEGGDRQPLIEREDDPFLEPGVFNRVMLPWARGETLLRNIRCAEVRLGKPTLEMLEEELLAEETDERLEAIAEEFEEGLAPLYIETDGTSEWVTFLVTDAPEDADEESIEGFGRVEVILDGITGLIWLQRPFYEDELELFKEHDWPPVLRRDFLRKRALTKEQVLEIQETRVRQ